MHVCVTPSCSAGVGRTGTLVTIDIVLEQLLKERVVDVAGTIKLLRNQRMKMVQNLVSEYGYYIHTGICSLHHCFSVTVMSVTMDLRVESICICFWLLL